MATTQRLLRGFRKGEMLTITAGSGTEIVRVP